jgi:2-dehydropantoate 2-reductase
VSGRHYVVYGAGAIGGIVAGKLHATGHNVSVVARGAHFEAIRDRGLTLQAPDGTHTVHRIPAAERIGAVALEPGDVVLLGMKSQDTEQALRELAAAAPEEIAVVCVQNGVENERLALRRFPNVYSVVVQCPGVHLEPGLVEMGATPIYGILDIGRYPSGLDDRAVEIAGALRAAGFLSEAREEILPWKYAKLMNNLLNGLMALSGPEAARSEVGDAIRAEGEAVVAAAGIPMVPREEWTARSGLLPRVPEVRAGNSSWQSLVRRTGSIEADFFNGEIALLARESGTEAPVNALVQRMARDLAAAGGAPGSVPLDVVRERLAQRGIPSVASQERGGS